MLVEKQNKDTDTWKLVEALTRLAFANQEAVDQAPNARVRAVLETTGRAADEAARHIQYGRRDQLTPAQAKLVAQCEKDL